MEVELSVLETSDLGSPNTRKNKVQVAEGKGEPLQTQSYLHIALTVNTVTVR